MTETDVLELAKEVLNYLDHGDTPYIKKVSWLAYEAAPALAAAVIRQAREIERLNKTVSDLCPVGDITGLAAWQTEKTHMQEEIEGLNIELRNKREAWDEYLKYGLDIAAMEHAQAEIALWQDEAAHQKQRADTYSRRAMVLFRRLKKFRMGGAR